MSINPKGLSALYSPATSYLGWLAWEGFLEHQGKKKAATTAERKDGWMQHAGCTAYYSDSVIP